MQINVNHQSTNDNHNYDNRRGYNNLPLQPGECLVPIRVDWEMVKHFNMCQDNLETWHIGPNKVLVAFAPVKIEDKPAALKQFNADVREHFASFKSDDVLSLDQFMDEATSEDGKGFEPASPENLEEEKNGSYKGLTEARRRANKKYNDRFVEIKVRVTPEKRAIIKDHAEKMGESATAFINRAIDEAMKRDQIN